MSKVYSDMFMSDTKEQQWMKALNKIIRWYSLSSLAICFMTSVLPASKFLHHHHTLLSHMNVSPLTLFVYLWIWAALLQHAEIEWQNAIHICWETLFLKACFYVPYILRNDNCESMLSPGQLVTLPTVLVDLPWNFPLASIRVWDKNSLHSSPSNVNVVLSFSPKSSFPIAKMLKQYDFNEILSLVIKHTVSKFKGPIITFNIWNIYNVCCQCVVKFLVCN